VILAHNYLRPAIQDLADFVSDSLQLSRQAAATTAETLVFCGVHFMAETAAIISPDKRVLIPDPAVGYSVAQSVTADEVRSLRAEHPDAIVVAYVNTDAELRRSRLLLHVGQPGAGRERDPHRPGDPVPARPAARWPRGAPTRRRLHLWPGECHVHASISLDDVDSFAATDLSFGLAVAGAFDGRRLSRTDPTTATFYREVRPVTDGHEDDYVTASHLDRARLAETGEDPAQAMTAAAAWRRRQAGDQRAVLVAWPLAFDWLFLYWYFDQYTAGGSPFGFDSCLDINTCTTGGRAS
jgi:hypothetical protein